MKDNDLNGGRPRISAALGLAAVLLVAAGLRLYNIQWQALTPDEYGTHIFDRAASLGAYFDLNAFRFPDGLPAYFVLLFGWTGIFGNSLVAERLLSVLCGLSTCVLLYAVGRRSFRPAAGFYAALLYGLSPFHVFHDQGIRPYALVMFLAAFSVYSLMRVVTERRPSMWLVFHVTANVLLVYTHLLGALLLLSEGLWLLVVLRERWRLLFAWALPQLLLVLPALLFVLIPDEDPRYAQVDWKLMFLNMFAVDAIPFNPELSPSQRVWPVLPTGLAIRYINGVLSNALTATLVVLTVAGSVRVLWPRRGGGKFFQPLPDIARQRQFGILLLMILLLPGLVFAGLSIILEPIPLPRYSIYASVGRYVLAGIGLALIPIRRLRLAAATCVVLLFAAQLTWLLPGGARPEFFHAAALVREEMGPSDVVFTALYPDTFYVHFPVGLDMDLLINRGLQYHFADIPLEPAHSMDDLAAKAKRHLMQHPESEVWLVVMRLSQHDPIEKLEFELATRGLAYERHQYYAGDGLTLYRVQTGSPATRAPSVPVDWMRLFAMMQAPVPTERDLPKALEALKATLDQLPESPLTPAESASLALSVGAVDPTLGALLAEGALKQAPDHGELLLARGFLLLDTGAEEPALEDLRAAARELNEKARVALQPVLESTVNRRYDQALGAFQQLQMMSGGIFPPLFERALRGAQQRATAHGNADSHVEPK